MIDNRNTLSAALQWAEQGFRIHPVQPGTKVPMLPDWPTLATTDPEIIRDWFVQYPDMNLGVATGQGSDIFVLDVDTAEGKTGDQSLAALEAEHGKLPDTLTLRTGRGGLHYVYRYPKGEGTWSSTSNRVGKHLDQRANGGQIVIWPSTLRGGGQYEIEAEYEIAECPEWLAVLAKDKPYVAPERPQIDLATLNDRDLDQAGRYAVAAVNGEVERLKRLSAAATTDGKGYSGDPWNQTTFQVAATLIRFANADWSGISEQDAYSVLFTHAPRDRGFTDETVDTIWGSARRYVNGAARELPESIVSRYLRPPTEVATHAGEFMVDGKFAPQTLAEAIMADGTVGWGVDDSTWRYEAGVWARDEDEIMRRVGRALSNFYKPERYRAVRDLVRTQTALRTIGGERPDEDYINVRNGMLHWRTGVLKPHDPSYFSTVQLPHEYDPDAACPHFDAWLAQVIPADTIPLMWEVIGYLAMSGNPLQTAILLHGDGGNGKGTFLRIMQRMLGSHNVSSVTLEDINNGKFEAVEMHGKIANIAGDLDPTYLRKTAKFKQMTGDDTMQVQRKQQRPFETRIWAVPVFSANEFWKSSDTSDGYFRRWATLPFPVKVRELGTRFDERLLIEEAPGILAKAIPALQTLMDRGRFELSPSAAQLLHDFRTQSDSARLWLDGDDWLDFNDPKQVDVHFPRPDLYRRYRDWCVSEGHDPMTSANWFKSLEHDGYTKGKIRGSEVIRGLSGTHKTRQRSYVPDSAAVV